MKAEISLIGDAIQYADWGMSWDEVREMGQERPALISGAYEIFAQ